MQFLNSSNNIKFEDIFTFPFECVNAVDYLAISNSKQNKLEGQRLYHTTMWYIDYKS